MSVDVVFQQLDNHEESKLTKNIRFQKENFQIIVE